MNMIYEKWGKCYRISRDKLQQYTLAYWEVCPYLVWALRDTDHKTFTVFFNYRIRMVLECSTVYEHLCEESKEIQEEVWRILNMGGVNK